MHVGTFTPEGTWAAAAAASCRELADLGVTALEVMPVAEFPGRFGWGYDGVDLFAPTRLYGTPDDFRRFVDRAHALGLGVILDVVYNHFGPDGNYLRAVLRGLLHRPVQERLGRARSTSTATTPARSASSSSPTPATGSTSSTSTACASTPRSRSSTPPPEHILAAHRAARARRRPAGDRTILVAENEPQETPLVRPVEQGGYGLDALWNDDFHHSAMVALTGRNEAYYTDYRGTPQEFISRAKYGYLYQGQCYTLAEAAARHAGARPAAGGVRQLPPEPRPGRQLRPAACAATS